MEKLIIFVLVSGAMLALLQGMFAYNMCITCRNYWCTFAIKREKNVYLIQNEQAQVSHLIPQTFVTYEKRYFKM